jgi:site-specific DNA-methyltransferase (adenine-specific)
VTTPSAPSACVYCDDCLDRLNRLGAHIADLAYLDPPFNTGKQQTAGDAAYDDRFATINAYLDFLRPRIEATHRALKPSGSILLHCDWRTCHHLRLMLDDVFGSEGFVNHLIWSYGLGGSSPRRFARKHDDIIFYAKRADYFFHPPLVPATSNRMKGRLKKATDVIDIPTINNMAVERVGYPTQKPLALLELLVRACCLPEGTVLDPFCGSGTSLIAAARLGRRAIGIDISEQAVAITRNRLAELDAAVPLAPPAG